MMRRRWRMIHTSTATRPMTAPTPNRRQDFTTRRARLTMTDQRCFVLSDCQAAEATCEAQSCERHSTIKEGFH
jgi:hypothetical protein